MKEGSKKRQVSNLTIPDSKQAKPACIMKMPIVPKNLIEFTVRSAAELNR